MGKHTTGTRHMDCFSDPVCIYNTLVAAVIHAAAFLDLVGYTVLGEQWAELVPVIEEYAGEIRRFATFIAPQPVNFCEPGTGAGALNA